MSSEEILNEIAAEVSTCAKCKLCNGRTRAVPGEGNPTRRYCSLVKVQGIMRTSKGVRLWVPLDSFSMSYWAVLT